MSTENKALMRMARDSLSGRWALAIGTFVLYTIITSAAGSMRPPLSLLGLILGGPFALGAALFSLSIARGQDARVEQIFWGFKNFGTALGAFLLMMLYIFLWLLLLIVPGIIAALSYSLTFYILADEPYLSSSDALKKSKAMMDGYKMKLFKLYLWFFLFALLCILTLGIGFLWLIPFVNVTMAKFYDDVKAISTSVR